MPHATQELPPDRPRGLILHGAARHYDRLAWLLTFGRERALRARLLDLARLAPGERVLDVGCGTGTLALTAKRRVGGAGAVLGVDASPEMIAHATRKAAAAGLDVAFHVGDAAALPVADASVDVVLSTLMLHHLPAASRAALAREARRVLRPGGRVLAVDFEAPARARGGLLARVHRHGGVPRARVVELLTGAGLRVVDLGSVGASDLQFVLTEAAGPGDGEESGALGAAQPRALPPLPWPRWLPAVSVAALVVAHLAVARSAISARALGAAVGAGALGLAGAAVALLAVAHVGVAGGVHAALRRRRQTAGLRER